MKFRPCIDLHQGQVKQIVGSTLKDSATCNNVGSTNFSTDRPASDFAAMYKRDKLLGGHVIMLGKKNNEAASSALQSYPNGLQIGGGITSDNAKYWLDQGASHVIVTSYIFDKETGVIDYNLLKSLVACTGKHRLVLDLSCRRKPNDKHGLYYVVINKWQTYTNVPINEETLKHLSTYCDEFLIHGVENEGKRCGILEDLVELLGTLSPIPVTYAGGVRNMEDLERVKVIGKGKVDVTIGSALDCFGGDMSYDEVVSWHNSNSAA